MQELSRSNVVGCHFLFVNYDASNPPRTLAHRKAACCHPPKDFVQNFSVPRLEKEQTKRLHQRIIELPDAPTHMNKEKELTRNDIMLRDQTSPFSPISIIGRGNSDPFNAVAIPMNAESNEIMVFGREYLISALYNVKRTVESVTATRFWNEGCYSITRHRISLQPHGILRHCYGYDIEEPC
jgi:hypothetical protein